MKVLLVLLASVWSLGATAQNWSDETQKSNAVWAKFLADYVKDNGGVDYVSISEKGTAALKEYLDSFAKVDPGSLSDTAKTALYINFYNAGMIANLLRYAKENKIDVKSKKFTDIKVKDIKIPGGNVWNGDYKFNLNGEMVHLDNIEHGLIRGQASGKIAAYKVKVLDPRIHSAVNCAAMSCPILRTTPYTPENLNAMLEENMKSWLSNDEQFKKVDKDTMQVNSIVIWYYPDFDDHAQENLKLDGAGHYLAPYVSDSSKDAAWKKKFLKEEFSDRSHTFLRISSDFDSVYDWSVSDVRNR